MASKRITGKELRKIGFPEGKAIGAAMYVLETFYKGKSKKQKLELMKRVAETPALYKNHETLAVVVRDLLSQIQFNKTIELNSKRVDFQIYGYDGIEQGAINQMEIAMKLPITVGGALMPDAHHGYGLPIGGVLAAKNAVIPYGVGMDIGCRMCLTVYDIGPNYLDKEHSKLINILIDSTEFGQDVFKRPKDHAIFSRDEFKSIKVVKDLKDKAYSQIGTSGGGNHFVEFGIVDVEEKDENFNLEKGKYLAVLSHSGSRGLGASIARHYTKLAMSQCKLSSEAKHLAWLDLNTQEGQEYWLAMTLAGDYASACHHQIHEKIAKALGEQHLVMVENHHNFAWKEQDELGNEIIVHRKGATPAGKGVLGIIPGSMTSPGFIVRGKGVEESINSASHGAGRLMSRRKAKERLSKKEVKQFIKKAGVEVIGSGLDEAPHVYKDIHKVMAAQEDLVEVLGSFTPKIVRMCGDKKHSKIDS